MAESDPIETNLGPRVRSALTLVASAGAVLCSLWLLRDATSYALRPADPSIGRPRGCYTALDLVLGLGPSDTGLLLGTRLTELLVGFAGLFFASVTFVRRLLRSELELPLVSLAGAGGMWLAGRAFFWRFHDTDMYLTWRIIGDRPNDLAAKVTAIAIVALNVFAVAMAWYRIKRRGRALRFSVYASLAGYLVAVLLNVLTFRNVTSLALLALPFLFVPVFAFFVGRRLSIM